MKPLQSTLFTLRLWFFSWPPIQIIAAKCNSPLIMEKPKCSKCRKTFSSFIRKPYLVGLCCHSMCLECLSSTYKNNSMKPKRCLVCSTTMPFYLPRAPAEDERLLSRIRRQEQNGDTEIEEQQMTLGKRAKKIKSKTTTDTRGKVFSYESQSEDYVSEYQQKRSGESNQTNRVFDCSKLRRKSTATITRDIVRAKQHQERRLRQNLEENIGDLPISILIVDDSTLSTEIKNFKKMDTESKKIREKTETSQKEHANYVKVTAGKP